MELVNVAPVLSPPHPLICCLSPRPTPPLLPAHPRLAGWSAAPCGRLREGEGASVVESHRE
eukprot:10434937-Prorocentrum_lima.AAC.1